MPLVACHSFINKIATKMLASTMQFSRYGRYLARCIAYPPEAGRSKEGRSEGRSAEALDPSGPNSVPDGGDSLDFGLPIPVRRPVVLTEPAKASTK